MEKTKIKQKAGVIVAAFIMLATVIVTTSTAQAKINELTIVRNVDIESISCHMTFTMNTPPQGMQVTINQPEPEETNDSEGGGGKASIFLLYANRFVDENQRLHLDGFLTNEIIWFNNQYHSSDITGYLEFWYTDNGTQMYYTSPMHVHTNWWGVGLIIIPFIIGITFPNHDKYEVQNIHVELFRTVDDFPTEHHERFFSEYIIEYMPILAIVNKTKAT